MVVGRLCRVLLGIERLRSEGEVVVVVVFDGEVPWPFYSAVYRASN